MMIVDGEKIINKQLKAEKAELVRFDERHTTTITPAHLRPVPDNSRFCLNGEWLVKYYPFAEKEISGIENNLSGFQRIQQPGKVFYADPETHGQTVHNWNRVSLDHLDERDGALLVKTVRLPEDWKGRKIFLRFDAIYPAAIIYLNGIRL
ncbi:MAG: hypothetical protein PHV82_10515, partial [Victivallaceae bacterium]|nr:hypothetical protein [Victivallaceae bacterium]